MIALAPELVPARFQIGTRLSSAADLCVVLVQVQIPHPNQTIFALSALSPREAEEFAQNLVAAAWTVQRARDAAHAADCGGD